MIGCTNKILELICRCHGLNALYFTYIAHNKVPKVRILTIPSEQD